MRRALLAGLALVVVGACTGTAEPVSTTVSTLAAVTTTTTATPPTTQTTVVGTSTTTTAQLPPNLVFSVALLGTSPEVMLGSTTALGSGCSPGTEQLPDGVWFAVPTEVGDRSLQFDLACIWDGRVEPAIRNESPRVRTIEVHPGAMAHVGDAAAVPYGEWEPGEDYVWLFVNDRLVTEISVYDQPVLWARSTTAWPAGMFPGCCDGGTVAPPSPDDPWPAVGWPADGFYGLWSSGQGDGYLDAEIVRWHSCDDRPDLCAEWWVGDEVAADPTEERLERRIVFDEALTVVIQPIAQGEDYALVGDGVAFAELMADLTSAIETHSDAALDGWAGDIDPGLANDPAFPFGPLVYDGEQIGYMAYRGPGGAMLSWSDPLWWWYVLEIRDGEPVLYVHAGLIAG